jgi:hypothetical protein
MEPGKLAIDEPFRTVRDCRAALGLNLFFRDYNGLRGFHEVQSSRAKGPAEFPAEAERMY